MAAYEFSITIKILSSIPDKKELFKNYTDSLVTFSENGQTKEFRLSSTHKSFAVFTDSAGIWWRISLHKDGNHWVLHPLRPVDSKTEFLELEIEKNSENRKISSLQPGLEWESIDLHEGFILVKAKVHEKKDVVTVTRYLTVQKTTCDCRESIEKIYGIYNDKEKAAVLASELKLAHIRKYGPLSYANFCIVSEEVQVD